MIVITIIIIIMIMIITIIQIIPSAKYLREGFPMITICCQIDDSLGTG